MKIYSSSSSSIAGTPIAYNSSHVKSINLKWLHLPYSWTSLIFGKNLVPEIWDEMLLANQIVGFLNQLYLYNKMMKKPDFLFVDTNSMKLKND